MEAITVNLSGAAELLGVNPDVLRPLLDSGEIPAFKFGVRDWTIPVSLLQKYAEDRALKEAERRKKCQK